MAEGEGGVAPHRTPVQNDPVVDTVDRSIELDEEYDDGKRWSDSGR